MPKDRETLFIKPCWDDLSPPSLDAARINKVFAEGGQTTLLLDTNVLIEMESVVENGNNWKAVKRRGLRNLVKLLEKCPAKSICLSPGVAFREMPPGVAEYSRKCYEAFVSRHTGFVDTPNSIRAHYKGKTRDYGFEDLEKDAQVLLSIPYVSLLHLLIVHHSNRGTAIEKFTEYLDRLSRRLDVVSAKEVQIAQYVFASPGVKQRATIEARRVLLANFTKTKDNKVPRNWSEASRVAFNGACDLNLLNSANGIDSYGLDGHHQDVWIATQDAKLAEFVERFHYLNIDGEHGKFGTAPIEPEHAGDRYWTFAALKHAEILNERNAMSRAVNPELLLAAAADAMVELRAVFEELTSPPVQ